MHRAHATGQLRCALIACADVQHPFYQPHTSSAQSGCTCAVASLLPSHVPARNAHPALTLNPIAIQVLPLSQQRPTHPQDNLAISQDVSQAERLHPLHARDALHSPPFSLHRNCSCAVGQSTLATRDLERCAALTRCVLLSRASTCCAVSASALDKHAHAMGPATTTTSLQVC